MELNTPEIIAKKINETAQKLDDFKKDLQDLKNINHTPKIREEIDFVLKETLQSAENKEELKLFKNELNNIFDKSLKEGGKIHTVIDEKYKSITEKLLEVEKDIAAKKIKSDKIDFLKFDTSLNDIISGKKESFQKMLSTKAEVVKSEGIDEINKIITKFSDNYTSILQNQIINNVSTKAVETIDSAHVTPPDSAFPDTSLLKQGETVLYELEQPFIFDYISVIAGKKEYVKKVTELWTGEGDPTYTSEGVAGGKIDVDWGTNVFTTKIVRAHAKYEESLDTYFDIAIKYLVYQTIGRIILKLQDGLLSGTNVGNQPNGIYTVAQAASVGTGLVAILAAQYNFINHGVNALADFMQSQVPMRLGERFHLEDIFLSTKDIYNLITRRVDSQNRDLNPGYMISRTRMVTQAGKNLAVNLFANPYATANTILFGMFKNYFFAEEIPVKIEFGYESGEFSQYIATLRGEIQFKSGAHKRKRNSIRKITTADLLTALT